ncbi:hypothetical protein TSAR_011219 [Trichomalopsis sarcophagae]|uniref:BTB domain-containing protein n=1 Tax=Trichomalopsis sarcophagae TaxID=543379 RepID=A0A232EER6_9HYME|nr:hypothetical protein TSAR_011219 [Trichomalopsis sarcophagae]
MAPKTKSKILGQVKTLTSKIKWHIHKFKTSCSQANVGDALKSPLFTTSVEKRNVQWYLMLYPRGRTQDNRDFLSIYLYSTMYKGQFEVTATLNILNNRTQVVVDCYLEGSELGEAVWGNHKLISTEFITDPQNSMLNDGDLVIICELLILPQYEVATFLSRIQVLEMFENLLNDSKFSDVSLVLEGKTIRAHKCILAKNSSVFAAMFDAESNERKEIVLEIHDSTYSILMEMIRFIYTGKVNGIENMIEDLAIAANKYALHRLMIICEQTMIKCLSIHNVIHSLLFADKLEMKELKAMAIEFIIASGSNAIDQENFRTLPMDVVLEVCSAAKTTTCGTVKTMDAKFEWQIPDFYTLCSQSKVGDVIKSPNFATTVGFRDVEWYLRLFPGGERQELQDFIALYLCNTKTVSMGKIVAKSNFMIRNSEAQVVVNHSMTESVFDSKTSWGIDQVIPKNFILDPANQLLTNGSLTIICEIIPMPRYLVKELKQNKEVHEQQPTLASRLELLDIYGSLIDDNIFSDVALISESRSVRAHKCILARSSSVFATMIDNEINKGKKEIILEVNDIRYKALLEMIRFIYTGKVNGIETMIEDLAIAAKKFALHTLLIICEQVMIKIMSIHNVVSFLLVADKVKMKELKAMAIEFVTMSGSNVIDQPSFKTLPSKIIFKICSNLANKYK